MLKYISGRKRLKTWRLCRPMNSRSVARSKIRNVVHARWHWSRVTSSPSPVARYA